MIQNLMDRHVPHAIADYRRLHDLDNSLADTTKIKHSDLTGKEALLDVLETIDTQFDDLLNASYHQDGQKLLATNRYLQQRFNTPTSHSDRQQLNSSAAQSEVIESPTGADARIEDSKL